MGFQAQHPTNRFGSKGTPGHTPLSHTPDIPTVTPQMKKGIPNHKLFWLGVVLGMRNRMSVGKLPTDRTRNLRFFRRLFGRRALWRKATPGRSMPERHRSLQHDGDGSMAMACAVRMLRWWNGEAPCLTRGKTMEVVQEKMYQVMKKPWPVLEPQLEVTNNDWKGHLTWPSPQKKSHNRIAR